MEFALLAFVLSALGLRGQGVAGVSDSTVMVWRRVQCWQHLGECPVTRMALLCSTDEVGVFGYMGDRDSGIGVGIVAVTRGL